MGPLRCVDNRVVELVHTSYGSSISRLCPLCYDPGGCLSSEPGIRADRVPNFPTRSFRYDHSCLHIQYADPVDRQLQFVRLDFEHDMPSCCGHIDSGCCNWF